MNENKQSLSVIVPALNEEANIALTVFSILKAMDEFSVAGEIIVVSDGSTDKTSEIVGGIIEKDSRVKILIHSRPWGIGGSFWDGVDNSSGEIVLLVPGDNETDPREILCYFGLLDQVDIVVPFFFNQEVRPFFRRVLSFLYRAIVNFTFSINLNYTNGTILYRKSLLKQVGGRSSGFFFQTDILARLLRQGYLFAEVPSRLLVRRSGESKAISFRSLAKVVNAYIFLVWDFYFLSVNKPFNKNNFAADSVTFKKRRRRP